MSRILLLSIIYSPNRKNIYTDLVEALVRQNHSVTVITSLYDSVNISNDYKIIGFEKNYRAKKSYKNRARYIIDR